MGVRTEDERRAIADRLVRAGIAAVDPRVGTERALARVEASGVGLRGCTVIAFGKAARGMAEAAIARCAPRGGIAIARDEGPLPPLVVRRGGHPIPASDAAVHGREVLELARSLGAGDLALCLVSGGGSAMLELPAGGVSIEAMQETTRALLRAGADIAEVNAVRRRLSEIKGGRLAEAIAPATIVNVVLSDVPGAPPSLVASGPTFAPENGPDAREVIARRGLRDRLPREVVLAIDRERPLGALPPVVTELAGDNDVARRAIVEAGAREGISLVDLSGYVSGEARDAGAAFVREARARCERDSLDGVVGGGETTVTVRGDGRGGRNQEFVLGAWREIEAHDGLVASIGTDGVDGTSDAAGAMLDRELLRAAGSDPDAALRDNDADAYLRDAGGRIVTGPTGTNVADVCLYLR